ncbi:MAG: DnaJ domain-containing protein [Rhodospirillales bacterium]|nr:DnaJ domain-containing protein [Rhodospirillales bacterium]MDE0710807.1 DnaJ domain-containing protein [Rhodospirillales bacterium]
MLGIAPTASDDEIKTAHRSLVRKFHPDHLVSKGLPDELIEHATERLAAINSAYEAIMKSRPRQ